jgi:rRNA maturation endonuclease Nob1
VNHIVNANKKVSDTIQCERCFRVAVISKSGKTYVCTICGHREKVRKA